MKLTKLHQRAWINQPSTLQLYHKLHGERVLALLERGYLYIWFLKGNTVSQRIDPMALSPGWPEALDESMITSVKPRLVPYRRDDRPGEWLCYSVRSDGHVYEGTGYTLAAAYQKWRNAVVCKIT